MASQKQWLDVGVHKLHGYCFIPSARRWGESAEVVAQWGLLGTQGRLALDVNVRGGFEGGLEGLKIREAGGVEGPSARAGMEVR